MPICNKPAQALSQTKNATEFDDYASEAAKMKRTREQAYFNSYNFDAIQPYDEDVEALQESGVVHKVGGVAAVAAPAAAVAATHPAATITATKVPSVVGGGSNSQSQQLQQSQQQQLQKPQNTLKTMYRGASSIASSTQSTRSSSGCGSQHSRRSSDVDAADAVGGYVRRPQHAAELTYTYMQRFGVRLVRSRNSSPSADVERGGSGGGAITPAAELAPVHGKKSSATEVSEGGSFLLPRAMLKYQSVGNANSMPLAVSGSGRADKLLQNGHNHQQQSGSNESNYNNSNNSNNSASYNKYNNNSNSSGKAMMMMTTNAISNKHNNNNSSLSSNKSNATAIIANTKTINNSNSNSSGSGNSTTNSHLAANSRLNYANSNDGYASLLVASDVNGTAPFRVATAAKTPTTATAAAAAAAKAKATAANSAPGAAVRVKKQSTSSTITTTTTASSVSAAEHNEAIAATATAAVAAPTRGNGKSSQTSKSGDTKSAQSGSVERRGRTSSHQSHYSTDKSGSSGYYSSNVCSTYSLDEHIYCEPVIDILDVSRNTAGAVGGAAKTGKSARLECANTKVGANSGDNINKSNQTTTEMSSKSGGGGGGGTKRGYGRRSMTAVTSRNGESGIAGCSEPDGEDDCDGDAEDESAAAAVARRGNSKAGRKPQAVAETTFGANKIPASLQFLLQRQTSDEYGTSQHFSENLRILETSIENLDRHLKNFPSLSSHEHIAAFVQAHHHHQHQHQLAYLQATSVETGDKQAVRVPTHVAQHQLPTIMEGYDPAHQPRRSWPDDMVDDSLLDIDLDSFLLVNERKAGGLGKSARKSAMHAGAGGIDNPTFLTEEQEEENNYKCAKYINSCPDDAYHVESDIVAGTGTGTGTGTVSEKSVSVAEHYMKRYEDQLHFQSTRELLEDVRDKIRLLSQASGHTSRSGSANSHSPDMSLSVTAPTEQLPRELEGMIKTLKNELENYLDRMNQHSELEIRQLCSGLVRNHNIVKMKKAFERRRSTHSLGTNESDYGYVGNYEAICDGVPSSIREQIVSIRCASDPNFKMKRKSLTEVFPVADCYAESEKLQTLAIQPAQQQLRPSLPRRDRVEQRQREHDQNVITLHVPTTQLQRNLSFQQPILSKLDAKSLPPPPTDAELSGRGSNANGAGAAGGNGHGSGAESGESGDKDSILEWHRKKPSIWEMYYGTNRMNQSLLGKRNGMVTNNNNQVPMSYPSSRPESDFTLDLPRAEQLRIKMEKEKKFRQRCRYITTFLSLVFFLLTVMVVSLVLTRGKRMFGSMI